MALRKLFLGEMIQLSKPWVDKGDPARTAIEKVPLLYALLSPLEVAHKAIFALRPPADNPQLREMSDRASTLDADHDERVRGIYWALTGLAPVSDAGAELLSLRDTLLPEGLSHTQKSFRAEAGHAAMIASQLDADLLARLKAVILHDKNLLDLTQGWLGVAKQLGDLEEERARLMPATNTAADINMARLAWIRIVNALLANAELAGLDSATDHLLFAALRDAEQAAEGRGKRKPAPGPTPTPPST